MSIIGDKFQCVGVWNEAPVPFDGAATDPEPVWSAGVQELRSRAASGDDWVVTTLFSVNCKTKKEAAQEAVQLLRKWAEALDAEAREAA